MEANNVKVPCCKHDHSTFSVVKTDPNKANVPSFLPTVHTIKRNAWELIATIFENFEYRGAYILYNYDKDWESFHTIQHIGTGIEDIG